MPIIYTATVGIEWADGSRIEAGEQIPAKLMRGLSELVESGKVIKSKD